MARSQPSRASVDLTLVVNVATEGRLVHPTFRSLDRAVAHAVDSGWSVEVVVVFDGGSPVMRAYLDEHLATFFEGLDVRVVEVANRDLGLSRNDGVKAAGGRYIAFSDADNLYSANWLTDAVRRLASGDGSEVAHPGVAITFEARDSVWRMPDSTGSGFEPIWLAEHNFWDSACVVPRAVVLDVPYPASSSRPAFGPEDWAWNIETIDRGFRHVVVPETVMFYRVKRRGSLLASHDGNSALLAPVAFLARPRPEVSPQQLMSNRKEAAESGARSTVRRLGRAGWRSLRWLGRMNPRLRRFGSRLRPALSEFVSGDLPETTAARDARLHAAFPERLLADWRAAHELEPLLFPSAERLRAMTTYVPTVTRYTPIYWDLVNRISFDGESPEYVFLVPFLIQGGATTVLTNYLLAILESDPDARIAVLVTSPRQPAIEIDPRLTGVHFVEVPLLFDRLPDLLQERLIATLLVQFGPRVVHLINSHIGYRAFARHAAQLASRSKLFLSLFTIDESPEGQLVHPALDGIREYADELSAVFIDNQAMGDRFIELFALPRSLFVPHFQPTPAAISAPRPKRRQVPRAGRLSVLWAGRLDRQKRPDILLEIAERTRARDLPIDFFASGVSVLDDHPDLGEQLSAAGVELLGPYEESIASLDRSCDVLLNTSQWEGLPLVLIDAALNNVTILAASVGGIMDFVVDRRTGFLVDRFDDVDAYVDRLAALAVDRRLLTSTRAAAKSLAESRHNWHVFVSTLRSAPGYLA